MGEGLKIYNTSPAQINLNYVFVVLSLIVLLIRYRKDPFSIYVIFLFYNGLMAYLSKGVQDSYKIAITLFSLYYLLRKHTLIFSKKTDMFIFSFFIFSFSFFLSAFLNGDYFSIIFSQYARYFLVFTLALLMHKYRKDPEFKKKIETVVYDVLLVQILLTICKFFIMGPRESIVGSVSAQGGATATVLPMLGFIFLWLKNRGELKRKDWYFVLGLIFIGFVGAKRAIWFVMPALIAAFMFYVPKRKIPAKLFLTASLGIPLIFYLGVRLNPSLNKEHEVWGSFDLNYTIDYVEYYSFGESQYGGTAERGRGSATLLVYDKYLNGDLNEKDWLGHGLTVIYATSFEDFSKLGFDISHKGSATGLYQTLIANGYLGVMITLVFGLTLLAFARNRRVRIVLLCFFFWEYFFYTGIVLRDYAMTFLFTYAVVFSDIRFSKKVLLPDKLHGLDAGETRAA